jgi:hypothetical protein
MALDLLNGISFKKNDPVEIIQGTTSLPGTVLNSGEGYMSPYEDMYYLMSAPNRGLQDLFAEENEIKSMHVLVSVTSKTVPFSTLPASVELAIKNREKSVAMDVLAIICGRPGKDEYLVFLEVPGKKK